MQGMTGLNVLRMFRLSRGVRIGRLLNSVRELKILILSIVNSLLAVGLTLILVFLTTYAFSLFLAEMAIQYRKMALDNHIPVDSRLIRDYGSLTRTMMILYFHISSGTGCEELLEPFGETDGMTAAFILYSSFVTFCMMNVITSIFVEQSANAVEIHRASQIQEQLQIVFADLEEDTGSGPVFPPITREVWEDRLFHSADMKKYLEILQLSVVEAIECDLFGEIGIRL